MKLGFKVLDKKKMIIKFVVSRETNKMTYILI